MAGPRQSIPPVGRVHPGVKGCGPTKRSHVMATSSESAALHWIRSGAEAAPGDVPGGKRHGGPGDGRDGQRLVLQEGGQPRGYSPQDQIRFAVNALVIARAEEAGARQVLSHRVPRWCRRCANLGRWRHKPARPHGTDRAGGPAHAAKTWCRGFKAGLMGTPLQAAQRIGVLRAVGVNLVRRAFLDFIQTVEAFGRDVVPRIRARVPANRGESMKLMAVSGSFTPHARTAQLLDVRRSAVGPVPAR